MTNLSKRIRLAVSATVVVIAATGCAPDPSDAPVPSQPPVAVTNAPDVVKTGVVVRITVIDNNFRPKAIAAKVGDEVTFTNKGKNDHNVLPKTGIEWGTDVNGLKPGESYSYVFSKPGVYPFYCSIHGTSKVGMVGTITVSQ
ncbi:MAG: plastocyanin/azurin family copper-binding protein [Actinomycetota bacterium]